MLASDQLRLQNYLRERAGVEPLPDKETMLYCHKCNTWKPDDDFYRHSSASPNRRGRKTDCRPCNNEARRGLREETKHPCPDCGALILAESKQCVECAGVKYNLPFSWRKPYPCVDCGGPAKRPQARCLSCHRSLTRTSGVCVP